MKSFFDKLYTNNRYAVGFFAVLSLFFFIGLGNVHLFDWDEINFAESAREMMRSGDYLRVQINYTAFWEKPPFFFWLQVLGMKLFGVNEFAARFPNAVFGLIYLITFYFIGKRHFSAKFGLIWALVFFGSLLPHIYFKSGIIDPVFNYFIFMSVYFMLRVIGNDASASKLAILAGIFSGLSVLTKGPVGFLLLGMTLAVYLIIKKFKGFPKPKYILLFFAGLFFIVSIWLSAELFQNGMETLKKFIAYQLELFSSDVAGHAQPFYYHFVVVFLGCFPISIIALPAFKRKKETPFDLQTWMLCLFWVVMIIFSITTTKIIHYSSMTYIPLSFLATIVLYRFILDKSTFRKWQASLYLIVGLILGVVFVGLPLLLMNKELLYPYMNDPFAVTSLGTNTYWSGFEALIGIVFIAGVITSFILIKKRRILAGVATNAVSLGATLILILFFILPKIESFTQGPAIAFYKQKKGEDCYIESFGFKSYAQYYYAQTPYGLREESKDIVWLLKGEIDKPVYLVSKSTNRELDDYPGFEFITAEGGFRFYKRLP
jgi:hypothetical protein